MADEAHRIGLVSQVVAPEQVMEHALATAEEIAQLPPKAVKTAKAALYRSVDRDIETALQLTAALQSCVQRTDEHHDAVEAMLQQISNK